MTEAVRPVDHVLLLGVDEGLFFACFGPKSEWFNCEIVTLEEDCSKQELEQVLQRPGWGCVVIDDTDLTHMDRIQQYYQRERGFVVYFGIEGVFQAPTRISQLFEGVDWTFSAYTAHEYILTPIGREILGDAVTEQQYTKCNLLRAPAEDRILVPKPYYPSLQKFIEEEGDSDNEDEAYYKQMYDRQNENLQAQVPLVLHRDMTHGGRIAYLGFVNDDGNIPQLVRALCTGRKVPSTF